MCAAKNTFLLLVDGGVKSFFRVGVAEKIPGCHLSRTWIVCLVFCFVFIWLSFEVFVDAKKCIGFIDLVPVTSIFVLLSMRFIFVTVFSWKGVTVQKYVVMLHTFELFHIFEFNFVLCGIFWWNISIIFSFLRLALHFEIMLS